MTLDYTQEKIERLEFSAYDGNEVITIDGDVLDEFVSTLKLTEKEFCRCLHSKGVRIIKSDEVIDASICDHCFDTGGKSYEMPKDFYDLFSEYVDGCF